MSADDEVTESIPTPGGSDATQTQPAVPDNPVAERSARQPAVPPSPSRGIKGYLSRIRRSSQQAKAKRVRSWTVWRTKYTYWRWILLAPPTYVALALGLLIGLHQALVILPFVWIALFLPLLGYLHLVALEWFDQQPTDEQMKRPVSEKALNIPCGLLPRVMKQFTTNPLTGRMTGVFIRISLRSRWWFNEQLIKTGTLHLLGLIVLVLLAFVMPLHAIVGLAMLLLLSAGITYLSLKASYESVIHVITNSRLILMNLASPWLFWKVNSTPSASISRIDFSNPRATWWGRRKFVDSGRLGQDTAANTDVELNGMDYVKNVFDVAAQIGELQQAMFGDDTDPRTPLRS